MKLDESESGQMVFLKMNLAYYDAYLWKSCKRFNEKAQTANFSVFTMGRREFCAANAKKRQKLEKLKRKLLKILNMYDLCRGISCES